MHDRVPTCVRVAIASLLICTALLKIGTPAPSWFAVLIGSPSALWVAAVCLELLLGVLLLSGCAPQIAWAGCAVLFAYLSGVAMWLSASGHSHCGCFGQIPVSPNAAAVLDGILGCISLAMVVACVPGTALSRISSLSGWFVGVAAIVLMARVDVFQELRATLSPNAVVMINEARWLGDVKVGEVKEFEIKVRNNGETDLLIMGSTGHSLIDARHSLPLSLRPNSTGVIKCTVLADGPPGISAMALVFFTNSKYSPTIHSQVSVRRVALPGNPSAGN